MQYVLIVKVPFPGIGNSLKLEVPVTVTSGIDKPLAQSGTAENDPPILDLPPCVAFLTPYLVRFQSTDRTPWTARTGTQTPMTGRGMRRTKRLPYHNVASTVT